jgi:hypothetical protein
MGQSEITQHSERSLAKSVVVGVRDEVEQFKFRHTIECADDTPNRKGSTRRPACW